MKVTVCASTDITIDNEIWVKEDNPNFDVTMRSSDGAEVCYLVSLYLLNSLKSEFGSVKRR